MLKNKKADNSAIFLDIKLKFAKGAHLENFLDIFSVFFENLKIFGNIFKNILLTKVLSYILIFEHFENPR